MARPIIHGMSKSPEWRAWRHARDRCNRPTHKQYSYYGGRGICVCKRWESFANFIEDMGCKPSSRHTLDRINNNGDYEPSNCRWVLPEVQNRNKRSNIILRKGSEKKTLAEWARQLGISKELAHWRWKTWGTLQKGSTWRQLLKDE